MILSNNNKKNRRKCQDLFLSSSFHFNSNCQMSFVVRKGYTQKIVLCGNQEYYINIIYIVVFSVVCCFFEWSLWAILSVNVLEHNTFPIVLFVFNEKCFWWFFKGYLENDVWNYTRYFVRKIYNQFAYIIMELIFVLEGL